MKKNKGSKKDLSLKTDDIEKARPEYLYLKFAGRETMNKHIGPGQHYFSLHFMKHF